MSITNNSREKCGFGCLLNRYKTPLLIGGGILAAAAVPFVGPAVASGLASLGAGEALAGGLATAATSVVAASPAIAGQAISDINIGEYEQGLNQAYQGMGDIEKAEFRGGGFRGNTITDNSSYQGYVHPKFGSGMTYEQATLPNIVY
tara:strand:+ start:772 stop:1212 length:441 start_codon:yes stop_codon:yes gene_type:complete